MTQVIFDFKRPRKLDATFYFLRHATSLANEEGIIVSSLVRGINGYGLSPKGFEEIKASASDQCANPAFADARKIVVVTSPFKRAFETAWVAKLTFRVPEEKFHLDAGIRERDFGSLELAPNKHYSEVWEADQAGTNSRFVAVESVSSVYKRGGELILRWNQIYPGHTIIVVGHGDSLQITQCFMQKVDPKLHRSLPHLNTAEFRKMEWVA